MTIASIAAALVPIAALLGLGVALRRVRGFGDPAFWSGAERLAYFVLLPVLLFVNIATVDLAGVPLARMAAAVVVPTLLVTVVLFALHRVVAPTAPAFTSVLQGGIRFNTYIGLSLAGSLFGSEGSAVAAIVAAILVPTVNVISSLGFEFLRTGPTSLLALIKAIVTNPLVLGCVAGAAANITGLGLPDVAATVLDPLAAASLPIGLLCVGAGLQSFSMRAHARAIIASTLIKLLVLPGLSLTALAILDIPTVPALVGLIFQSIATASSGYVMARQLGGDAKLMAALIAGQTVVMLLTLPIVLLIGQSVLG